MFHVSAAIARRCKTNGAARHYDEQDLGALVVSIGLVNLWNRINVSTKQVPGASRS